MTSLTPEEAGALAHPSRQAIAEALGASGDGLTVAELASRVGLHTNAVRQHLARLQRAGVVVAAPTAPTGRRGRPSVRYALAAPAAVAAVGHRELVRLLLELVRRMRATEDDVEAFGWERGRGLVSGAGGAEALTASLAGLGFAPEEVTPAAGRRHGEMDVRLRACPFKEAVLAEGGHLICALHRGLVRGALERIDDGADLAVFEPKDPVTAGCRVLVRGLPPRAD
ncbi:helix-turn-helix domain-containing protein [Phycicoccus sp.]|uniref:helix-turn-helix transcriptional regulator n=1 Tax=Phycicoccus sp. TaxID=1902410 RepID=UPI002C13393D|nr:helix-turn-helix domain-containing protein [Phycicoccus sp.]HMM97360.1 helix-turn-helix domain-containing protein [Phycicoccus sp.]